MKKFFILAALLLTVTSAFAQMSSQYSCNAYTQCFARDAWGRMYPNGEIYCETLGYMQTNLPNGSSCTWNVIPNRAVRCAGYQWNGYQYQWNVVEFVCP